MHRLGKKINKWEDVSVKTHWSKKQRQKEKKGTECISRVIIIRGKTYAL